VKKIGEMKVPWHVKLETKGKRRDGVVFLLIIALLYFFVPLYLYLFLAVCLLIIFVIVEAIFGPILGFEFRKMQEELKKVESEKIPAGNNFKVKV